MELSFVPNPTAGVLDESQAQEILNIASQLSTDVETVVRAVCLWYKLTDQEAQQLMSDVETLQALQSLEQSGAIVRVGEGWTGVPNGPAH